MVIKSGKAICGHSWNRKAVLGMGEAPKLVGLRQQKLCQSVGSSCVSGRAVHEAPPDVTGACSEGVESSTLKFNIMSICNTTFP